MSNVVIQTPTENEFSKVKKYVEDFWLDNENMEREQFRVLLADNKLAAFARLRENNDATELCTLGVLEEYRGKHYGAEIVKHLLKESKRDVYIVCVIPGFFSKIGFKPVKEYPASIAKKVNLCTTQYHVNTPYEAMKWTK